MNEGNKIAMKMMIEKILIGNGSRKCLEKEEIPAIHIGYFMGMDLDRKMKLFGLPLFYGYLIL